MKFLTKLLTLLTFSAYVMAECSLNCSSCGILDGKEYCFVCDGATWINGVCNGAPPADCRFHSTAGCMTCNFGFVLNKNDNTCSPAAEHAIKGCIVQWSTTSGATTTYGCNVCEGGSPQGAACTGPMPAGCKYGALDAQLKPACVLCADTTQVSINGQCVASFSAGCILANDKGQCIQCSEGYYMKFSGLCAPKPAAAKDDFVKMDI